jgi:hypothetical protein
MCWRAFVSCFCTFFMDASCLDFFNALESESKQADNRNE